VTFFILDGGADANWSNQIEDVKIEPEEVKVPVTEDAPEVSVKLEDSGNNTRQLRRRKINLSRLKVGNRFGRFVTNFLSQCVPQPRLLFKKKIKIICFLGEPSKEDTEKEEER
jgi:hypothetical protein